MVWCPPSTATPAAEIKALLRANRYVGARYLERKYLGTLQSSIMQAAANRTYHSQSDPIRRTLVNAREGSFAFGQITLDRSPKLPKRTGKKNGCLVHGPDIRTTGMARI